MTLSSSPRQGLNHQTIFAKGRPYTHTLTYFSWIESFLYHSRHIRHLQLFHRLLRWLKSFWSASSVQFLM